MTLSMDFDTPLTLWSRTWVPTTRGKRICRLRWWTPLFRHLRHVSGATTDRQMGGRPEPRGVSEETTNTRMLGASGKARGAMGVVVPNSLLQPFRVGGLHPHSTRASFGDAIVPPRIRHRLAASPQCLLASWGKGRLRLSADGLDNSSILGSLSTMSAGRFTQNINVAQGPNRRGACSGLLDAAPWLTPS